MGLEIPAATSLESPEAKNEITWKKETDQTGFAYSGKNTFFKSGEGEFLVAGQGDSFAGSHAYLLLADVPGASANSGTTLTAKDSAGKQAFVATETRTGGEQEVAVGAGSEFKTLIDNNGNSDFLPKTGEASAEWNGGSRGSKVMTIEHGLGATPSFVGFTALNNSSFVAIPLVIERTKTKVTVEFQVPQPFGEPAKGSKQTYLWQAKK
jgi:hypothetical protein